MVQPIISMSETSVTALKKTSEVVWPKKFEIPSLNAQDR
jgi:hypothetical protein